MLRHLSTAALAALLTATLLGCGDDGTPPNVPPTATITSPSDGATFLAGESIAFRGTATDQEDDTFGNAALVWRSDPGGQLGTGRSITASLDAGTHTVTFTATDSDGATGVDSITIEVEELQPACSPDDPAREVRLAVGEHAVYGGEDRYCLRFDDAAASGAYLLGVQSASELVGSLTPFLITGTGGAGAMATGAASAGPSRGAALDPDALLAERALRVRRHRGAERRIRRWERAHLPGLEPARGRSAGTSAAADVMWLPADVAVGDTVEVRVPNAEATEGLCSDYTTVSGVARVVGEHSVWLEDAENPPAGFTTQDFQELSDRFDDTIYEVDSRWFGPPTDIDGNGRVGVLITKEVNKVENLLGFVFSGDLFERTQCPASSEGELYYGKAPDPNGTFGAQYSTNDAKADAPFILAHEFVHTIQFGRRLQNPDATSFLATWTAEGQATLAEEVNGFAFDGRGPDQNYGFDVAFEDAEIPWYVNAFVDLALYFGFDLVEGTNEPIHLQDAPHECSWLDLPDAGNDGPCVNERLVYGVSWSILRWISDQYGPGYSGGATAIQRALVDGSGAGYENVEAALGVPMEEILAGWAAMLYVDDRGVADLDPRLRLTSWNLFDIFSNLRDEAQLAPIPLGFTTFSRELRVRGGSSAYFRLEGGGGATDIGIVNPAGATLPATTQTWIVRLR